MRNIKFRGWDKEYEKMTYFDDEDYEYKPPFVFRLDQIFKKDSNYDDYEDFEYNDVTDNVEVMQYTGLKDKNGKEIYEGDILELNKDGRIFYGTSDGLLAKKYQLVGFKEGAFMTCRNKHLIDDYDTYLWIISKYSTVAGNIYDNPELLEKGE